MYNADEFCVHDIGMQITVYSLIKHVNMRTSLQ